jgi:hypothetical protein
MSPSRFTRRRRQLAAVLAGLCVAAGSLGTAALADSGSSTSASASVDASILVHAGLSPINARQAAANLNAAIDSAAQTMARSAATAIPSRAPLRTTAAATKAFAAQADGALTDFVAASIPALHSAGAAGDALVNGTLTALAQVVRTMPAAIGVTANAEVAVAGGADSNSASASVNASLDPALRRTVSNTVHALQPLLPLTRATLQAVAAGVRQVVDASIVAVDRIVRATVDLACAVVNVTASTIQAARSVADSAVVALGGIMTAVDYTLDHLSGPNISAQVDASLSVSASAS